MLKLSLVRKAPYNSLQKVEVNIESLSEIILRGMPWSLTMSRMNTCATVGVVKVVRIGEKWATLVNVSTVTMMAS